MRARGSFSDRCPVACVIGSMDLIRALGLAGIPSVVVAPRGDRVRYSRFAVGAIDGSPAGRLERLEAFAASEPEPPVLYYQTDESLRFVSDQRDRLGRSFRFVIPDAGLVDALLDKGRFAELAGELGLPVPRSAPIHPGDGSGPATSISTSRSS